MKDINNIGTLKYCIYCTVPVRVTGRVAKILSGWNVLAMKFWINTSVKVDFLKLGHVFCVEHSKCFLFPEGQLVFSPWGSGYWAVARPQIWLWPRDCCSQWPVTACRCEGLLPSLGMLGWQWHLVTSVTKPVLLKLSLFKQIIYSLLLTPLLKSLG